MGHGLFITFEGLDGSGKTTQLRHLAAALEAEGRRVVTLRQPGSTPLGDRIRALLLDARNETELGAIAPEAELALMFADRAQSLQQVILPALADGAIVLCDRFTDSSEAYQGAGRGLGSECILALHRAICHDIQPDLTLLLLPPLHNSLHRARRRNQRHTQQPEPGEDRFEREGGDFYSRVYKQYREIARRDSKRVVVISDEAPIEVIALRILEAVHTHLSQTASTPAADSHNASSPQNPTVE